MEVAQLTTLTRTPETGQRQFSVGPSRHKTSDARTFGAVAFHAIVLFCPATRGSEAEGVVITNADAARGAASTAHAESMLSKVRQGKGNRQQRCQSNAGVLKECRGRR